MANTRFYGTGDIRTEIYAGPGIPYKGRAVNPAPHGITGGTVEIEKGEPGNAVHGIVDIASGSVMIGGIQLRREQLRAAIEVLVKAEKILDAIAAD